jgi:gliding motility-associated lipoprotein GldH
MKKKLFQFIFFIAIVILIISCDKNLIFDKYLPLPKSGWNKDSLLIFEIPVSDTLQNHNLYINVRYDIKYKYSNLWLFINLIEPGGKELTDTFEITLADQAGKWLGEGFGGIKTTQAVYKRNVYFPLSGNYRINIQQGMRENILKGITDIGFRLEKQD